MPGGDRTQGNGHARRRSRLGGVTTGGAGGVPGGGLHRPGGRPRRLAWRRGRHWRVPGESRPADASAPPGQPPHCGDGCGAGARPPAGVLPGGPLVAACNREPPTDHPDRATGVLGSGCSGRAGFLRSPSGGPGPAGSPDPADVASRIGSVRRPDAHGSPSRPARASRHRCPTHSGGPWTSRALTVARRPNRAPGGRAGEASTASGCAPSTDTSPDGPYGHSPHRFSSVGSGRLPRALDSRSSTGTPTSSARPWLLGRTRR